MGMSGLIFVKFVKLVKFYGFHFDDFTRNIQGMVYVQEF